MEDFSTHTPAKPPPPLTRHCCFKGASHHQCLFRIEHVLYAGPSYLFTHIRHVFAQLKDRPKGNTCFLLVVDDKTDELRRDLIVV